MGRHLCLLHGADTAVWIKDDDARAGYITEALHGGLARVATGGGKNHDLILHTALLAGAAHELGQHAEGHILKSGGRAAEQLQHGVLSHLHGGGQLLRFKLAVIGVVEHRLHLLAGEVGQQRRQYLAGGGQGVAIQYCAPVKVQPTKAIHTI